MVEHAMKTHTLFFQKIEVTSLFQYAFVDSVLGLPRVYP
jgi:hypothetical protein